MAGDWIKIEKATARKREILIIAGNLAIHPDHAFGLCFRFWSWCDENLENGHARNVTFSLLDQLLGHDGFAQAANVAGWLDQDAGSIVVPNFDRHLSKSAKNRALAVERKRKGRANVTDESQNCHAANVTKAGPEKRREEKSIISLSKGSPSLDDVLKIVGSTTYPLTNEIAEAYWHSRESVSWMKSGNSITNWQADLTRFASNWMTNERNKRTTQKPRSTHSTSPGRTTGAGDGINVPFL